MPVPPTKKRGLSPLSYDVLPEGQEYEPYIDAGQSPTEFTFKALGAGILFGILFGSANAYLGLRVGLTISTSIPVAVLTVAFFKALSVFEVKSTLLEANLSQTVGSASSSVASGVIFTLPALFLWGFSPSLLQMTFLALCGGRYDGCQPTAISRQLTGGHRHVGGSALQAMQAKDYRACCIALTAPPPGVA